MVFFATKPPILKQFQHYEGNPIGDDTDNLYDDPNLYQVEVFLP